MSAVQNSRLSFAKIPKVLDIPDLLIVQKDSFKWFIEEGLKEILDEISPIEDFSGRFSLEFLNHFFEEPLKSLDECKITDSTYSQPLYVTAQFLDRETGQIKQQTVFLGDFPIMSDTGTFIINGTERVIVSQLVRSPGVYFSQEIDKTSDKEIFIGKMIPGRGAWLEFDTDKRDTVGVRVDRKRRQHITAFLRALGVIETKEEAIELFGDYPSIQNTIERDPDTTSEAALIDLYRKLRPGEPATVESARNLVKQMFYTPKRYDLTKVGRYKVEQKLGRDYGEKDAETYSTEVEGMLQIEDIIDTIKYVIALHAGEESFENKLGRTIPVRLDDIDHFGNRRIRTVGELVQNQVRVGLSRLERVVRERMTTQEPEAITPQSLINIRPIQASLKEFFGTSQLSQFMDQPNPIAALTHRRRLSALGPGGLSRERAGFEVRDVHPSHYGRMCPIETPEGPNIGLIGTLATYGRVNRFGFIETPYWKVENGVVKTNKAVYLTASQEDEYTIAQANAPLNDDGTFKNKRVLSRQNGGQVSFVSDKEIEYMDVSPKQICSVTTALIPFLEHDDANRALMGSNMQRQAVPLVTTEAPYVGTGMEENVARDSGEALISPISGEVMSVTGDEIVVKEQETNKKHTFEVRKFKRSNQATSVNQKPLVKAGLKVKPGDVLADGPSTQGGELALGKNLLVAYMPWDGYNFEDSIVISERLVKEDVLTSVHIAEHEIEARDTKLGEEEITRDIPNVAEEVLMDLDEMGIVRIGAEVTPGDYLVGKVTPKGETELTPEERLLRAIFGEKAREVRDTSLRVPHGERGKVIDVQILRRDDGADLPPGVNQKVRVYVAIQRKIQVGDKLSGRHGNKGVISKINPVEDMPFLEDGTPVDILLSPLGVPSRMNLGQILETHLGWAANEGWQDFKGKSKASDGAKPGTLVSTPVFDGADENEIHEILRNVNPNRDGKLLVDENGKADLYDGRTGEKFDSKITVGYTYILKLIHLVDEKIHARSTGPYSMITQQPLGGKAQFGGQRFGEMEVWALEAYGASYALQELLTIKSDDTVGRVKVYESIVKGDNIPEPGIPESFKVLLKEMQSLCLNVEILSAGEEISMKDISDEYVKTAETLGIDMTRPEEDEAEV
ncbi:DNA-directed RNA polymerase subunit beta [Acidimicrobiaceae bacterium]|nr:DNA-directed RNA polymerase subunit beta [Acidimicrobiaceae bacterium]MDA9712539.1 DNA-directed RNA polymerase subunit beta [Acidimicrobiaceae bacterium]MDA9756945.1 DNA-directed RNA polymerase subunit beta [Acidimicrobiaceae bacterium]MEC7840954.1 DNA-directed RNA polymerase subunit beta [Actinomycetota bacterium]GIS37818.1 MAG: DNA-directed RNA polymerase subunit beta [Actinomycetota bacterium]